MSNRDPHNLQKRLEDQIHLVLLEMEEHPDLFAHKERLAVITTVGMWLTRAVKLVDESEPAAGATIRKYQGAFKTNVPRRGKGATGPTVYQLTSDEPDTAAD